ncbi:hypothetical protein ASG90_09260 [Nocardioides sp. Soil797]|nr:hypothetical protein ASG90_09260 [Nocardioides sp. Soil797]
MVSDLGGELLFDLITETKNTEWKVARTKLRYAYQLCITNPAGPGVDPATWGDGLPGMDGEYDAPLGGQGTPGVAQFVTEDWAAATATSRHSAKQLLADTLDLHHRLPRTHQKVEALEVELWRARRLAQETHDLSRDAARWIDELLAKEDNWSLRNLDRAIKLGVARFHPEMLEKQTGAPGRDDWDVTVDHRAGAQGTSTLCAVGSSLDLGKFHDQVADEAATMGRLGDTDTLGQRRAKALGVIADRQATLDLLGLLDNTPGFTEDDLTHPETGKTVTRRRSYLKAKLFVHLSLADLTTMCATTATVPGTAIGDGPGASTSRPASGGAGGVGVVNTNMFGPATTTLIADYLKQLGVDARVTPVIDTTRAWAVDQHDPPQVMRDEVVARDAHCVHPYCNVPSELCDLDHIVPYDENGPPGQTSPDGLAPLCRRHHRLKTHGGWSYVRNRDGTYTWTNQHGHRWLVTPFGTTELD